MHKNFCMLVVLPVLSAGSLFSQTVCTTSATPPIVRSEGLTERIGDLLLTCTGTPGNMVNANVAVILNTPVTNRLSSTTPDGVTGIVFTIDSGSGPQPVLAAPILASRTELAWYGVPITFSAAGQANLDIQGIRANAYALPAGQTILASISINNAGLALTNATLTAGTAQRGLYASYTGSIICAQSGSPYPANPSFTALLSAGSSYETVRVTEGFADAFQPLSGFENLNADSGERILVRYTGLPTDSLLYVPNVVAGTDALQPTSAGDFGLPVSGGTYAPSANGSLLLARVNGASTTGAGGTPVYQPGAIGSGSVSFSTVSLIPVASDGSAYVVYEVMDANPSAIESATIPTFLGLPANPNQQTTISSEQVVLAPSSTVGIATATDPLPRFYPELALPDCVIVGGCSPIPPQLSVTPPSLQFTIQSGVVEQSAQVTISNTGGGSMVWQALASYTSGNGWLSVGQSLGFNNSTVQVAAVPNNLGPGTYTASLLVDAGPVAGSISIPVTLTVVGPPAPTISSILNAASLLSQPVVPGSIATLMGTNFSGTNVSATFNNLPAVVIFNNATQINLVVPSSLSGEPAALLMVTVDGSTSAPVTVSVAPFEPAIFQGGIVNQDGTVNGVNNPAAPGSVIAMWGTGLSGNGTITANIGGQSIATPYYAGPAPGIPGVQQVNLVIPSGLPAGTTQVYVCGAITAGPPVCSVPVPLSIN